MYKVNRLTNQILAKHKSAIYHHKKIRKQQFFKLRKTKDKKEMKEAIIETNNIPRTIFVFLHKPLIKQGQISILSSNIS